MKTARLSLIIPSLLALTLITTSCQKLNFTGNSGSGSGKTEPTKTAPVEDPNDPSTAPISGEWAITYEYGGQELLSAVTFHLSGTELTGEGIDLARETHFIVQNGSVNGTEVTFSKKYTEMDPTKLAIQYIGKLEYLNNPGEYKGWTMMGRYSFQKDGQMLTGKWVATPKGAEVAQQPPETSTATDTAPPPPNDQPPANISGMYTGSYQFNFKKIYYKMWLDQDGRQVSGHGVDTSTNEQFQIVSGSYDYPSLTIVRKYTKGKMAATSRQIVFKGEVSPGPGITGETQFGGSWDGHINR